MTLAYRAVRNGAFSSKARPQSESAGQPSLELMTGLSYDMTPEKRQQAMDILREIADGHDSINDDTKVAFTGFRDFSMNILFIY
ncbi:MAG: hypothetical protein DHS20C11_03820 [Lysobacteraceae bacterium]|nr:MAG: hypothetical protein DHS20C11_03820 [Xanthomonadaceae bacterium]